MISTTVLYRGLSQTMQRLREAKGRRAPASLTRFRVRRHAIWESKFSTRTVRTSRLAPHENRSSAGNRAQTGCIFGQRMNGVKDERCSIGRDKFHAVGSGHDSFPPLRGMRLSEDGGCLTQYCTQYCTRMKTAFSHERSWCSPWFELRLL